MAYETFGCNEGNVFFFGIDKGNTNAAVMEFDSLYGIQYPGASGQQGGGNAVHFQYDILGTPTIVVITPDKVIVNQQISPPNTANVVAAVTAAGGIAQSCLTPADISEEEQLLSVAPNPVVDDLYIHIKNGNESETFEIKIYSLNGKMVVQESLRCNEPPLFNINVSGLKPGFYVVEVNGGSSIIERTKITIAR